MGIIANTEWINTPQLRPDMNLAMGEFMVMPDHFHGIVLIGDNIFNSENHSIWGDAMHRVSPNIPNTPNTPKNRFGPQSKNLGSIIRGFKSSVTTFARKNNIPFDLQTRYHDHIIRNYEEYLRISNYIRNNPKNWKKDEVK